MKRIVAVSDTHMDEWAPPPLKLEKLMGEADIIIHCGDFHTYSVYKKIDKGYELKAVFGNSDDRRIKEELQEVEKFSLEGVSFGVVHGGNYLNEFDDLGYRARELGVNVLVFGHIHRFLVKRVGEAILISPGSPTRPRLSIASCAVIEVDRGKLDVSMEIVQEKFCGMKAIENLRLR